MFTQNVVPCPVCRSEETLFLLEYKDFLSYFCQSCGTRFEIPKKKKYGDGGV